jgi:hypothetical protein
MILKAVLNNEIVTQITLDEKYTINYTLNVSNNSIIKTLDIHYMDRQESNTNLINLDAAINNSIGNITNLSFFMDDNKIAEFTSIETSSWIMTEDQSINIRSMDTIE